MKLLREEADRDSGDDAFDRGTNHDAAELISHSRLEPRGQPVKCTENGAQHYSKQGFGHSFFPPVLLLNFSKEIFNVLKRKSKKFSSADKPTPAGPENDSYRSSATPFPVRFRDTRKR